MGSGACAKAQSLKSHISDVLRILGTLFVWGHVFLSLLKETKRKQTIHGT